MISGKGFIRVIIRVLILIVLVFGLAYSYLKTELIITPIMFGLLILLSAIEMTWYLLRQERGWTRFLLSVKHKDFSRAYRRQAGSKEMQEAYDLITQSLEELESGKQAEYHLLRMVLGHISVAVACYSDQGEVLFSNKAFNALLGIPGLVNVDRLKLEFPKIHEVMISTHAPPSEWIDHGKGQQLFVKTESFKLKGKDYKLISLTDIKNPLDAKEFESYQKLMRVMTHEIMNSTTPILSLIRIVNQKLVLDEKLVELDQNDQKNIAMSLNAIEERTAGLLKFVEAYKQINRPIEPVLSACHSRELAAMITSLQATINEGTLAVHDEINGTLILDRVLIGLALNNLVKNAVEATNGTEKPAITVKLSREEDAVQIAVEDNGPGVPQKVLNQIFIPFFTTKAEGSGVGLALSRKIARAHKGSLEYNRVGNHTQFLLSIPQLGEGVK